MITQAELKTLVDYDQQTGHFTWKPKAPTNRHAKAWNTKWSGKRAGWIWRNSYVYIDFGGDRYQAHRLAWLYVYGSFPPHPLEIDHINTNGMDNRISNLRVATRQQQLCNTKRRRDNKSGHKGVFYSERHKKWLVSIRIDGKSHFIGLFKTTEEAVEARQNAARERHGKFAR
jgi:hypothetical protein